MKTKLRLLSLLLIGFLFTGCDSALVVMNQMQQNMGGRCAETITQSYLFNDKTQKYDLEGYIVLESDEGEDIEEIETNWVKSKRYEHSNNGQFGEYFESSPYSNSSYKIVVSCNQWQQ